MKQFVRQLKWTAGLVFFILFSIPIVILPRSLAVEVGAAIGGLCFRLFGSVRRTTVENIRNSLPYLERMEGWTPSHGAPEEIARRTFTNLGRSFVEVLKLYYGLGRPLIDSVEFRGMEHYDRAKAKGKGIIFITGHCGNWELMALSFGARYDEVAVVARRQKNARFNRFIERLRYNFGNSVIYTDGAARGIFYRLRNRGVVGILIDQVVQPNEGAVLNFLGRKAWTVTIPAIIADKTGTPLLPIFIHREGARHIVTIHPEIELIPGSDGKRDTLADTRELSRHIEEYIARYPDEWLWVYKRWKRVKQPAHPEDGMQETTKG